MGRKELTEAQKNKKDEFYTLMEDIDRELVHYSSYFNNKVVLCNCDNPLVSNFYKYFVNNFEKLNLKKIIAISYDKYQCGALYIYDGTNNKFPSKEQLITLNGDGDFRSEECISYLKQADVVVTNPPFSLFREYIEQLFQYNKQFLIISNVNAITYQNVFTRIQSNKVWLGINYGRRISGFIVPDDYELYGTETRVNSLGQKIISPNNCIWLTNLQNSSRQSVYSLNHIYKGNEDKYPKYDNYDGINVDRVAYIPKDYKGFMGVPITFLTRYNPNQFEIVKFRKGDDNNDLSVNGKNPYFRIIIRSLM